jgi:hypothetical protein
MKKNSHLSRVVLYQNLGFLAIMAMCYLGELLKLPSLIFTQHSFDFLYSNATLQFLLILAVWLLVSTSTRRMMRRNIYLERFMRVCSWCRQINYNDEWMPLEKFMKMGFDTPTTHGICNECLERQQAAARRAKLAIMNKNQPITALPVPESSPQSGAL